MNKSIVLLALALAPLILLAQTKPATHKSTHAPTRQSASRPAARPAAARSAVMMTTAAPASTTATAPTVASSSATATPVATVTKPDVATVAAAAPVTASAKNGKAARTAKPVRVSEKATPASSQPSGFRVGFRAGGSGNLVSGMSTAALAGATIDPVTGFHAGLVLSFGRRAFTIQPEILYSQYGFKLTSGADYAQVKYNVVEVPLLLKYTFGQSGMRFFVNAGPTATYLLNGTLSVKEGGETSQGAIEIGPNDGRVNYGGSLGLGVALKAGSGSFQIEARGTYLKTSDSDASLQNAKLSVAYLLPLGGH
ncbi:porin family protein [Fibrella aquatilis]|uniref:PorT family protein n=1 Tax=Fibrella aquatilis TaxID=2817059 RepID=A0A939G5N8_9BACT|nr:porin family protein [Fibrella aquatilis]MBO0930243.1 PorT family protein [Fibrella aquatilis]